MSGCPRDPSDVAADSEGFPFPTDPIAFQAWLAANGLPTRAPTDDVGGGAAPLVTLDAEGGLE